MAEQKEQEILTTISLEVVSADKVAVECEAEMVMLPGKEGELTVLPDHFPLLAHMDIGIVHYSSEGEKDYCFINGGMAQIDENSVTVVTSTAEKDTDIDFKRARAALERAEKLLQSPADEKEAMRARNAIKRAKERLAIDELLKQND